MDSALDLTPEMLVGLAVDDARSAVLAAGGFTRVRHSGTPMTYGLVTGRITLTVSDGIVIEAWADFDAPA